MVCTNQSAKVTAIDVSEESLDRGRYLKDRCGLTNLELRLLPIEAGAKLGKRFELINCVCVCRQTASPGVGIRALAGVLRPHRTTRDRAVRPVRQSRS